MQPLLGALIDTRCDHNAHQNCHSWVGKRRSTTFCFCLVALGKIRRMDWSSYIVLFCAESWGSLIMVWCFCVADSSARLILVLIWKDKGDVRELLYIFIDQGKQIDRIYFMYIQNTLQSLLVIVIFLDHFCILNRRSFAYIVRIP